MAEDIRFSKKAATLTHASARGKVKRNAGNFTRGSQLFHHEILMTWAGIRMPLYVWVGTAVILLCILVSLTFKNHEVQLVLMKLYAEAWGWVQLNPNKPVNLTLPSGQMVQGTMSMVPYHPAVERAWAKAVQVSISAGLGAAFICVPLTVWFVDFSKRRGTDILTERHERGAVLVTHSELAQAITSHNWKAHVSECRKRTPAVDPDKILAEPLKDRVRAGLHAPYRLAGVPVPWRLEQSHAMFIGTTGAGKTTELKKIVTQARERGHRCVIFDLTGTFVESFYDAETDIILNPMDRRCVPWSIFNDCDNYAEFMSAATALVPSGHSAEDDFWQKSARTLFVEMCVKMIKMGVRSNGALSYFLMQSDLKTIHAQLEGTIAGPMMSPAAAKMAESIRTTFIANANVFRFLPEPPPGESGFSIKNWMTTEVKEGSILFITSTHPDLVLNRPLLTLWMDLAVNALFHMGRSRDLRTWFLIDEVHALHRLPAIDHGLQTARAFGGAFVLGMHSFDKLEETYGENGATNLASLAGTKLILKTADPETSRRCSEFIGNRQVRIMDEAYSYGYNDNRDASTITPRTNVEELVMPVDISDLPSMHGFVKFPDGFPAARIRLTWKDYEPRAKGFERVTDKDGNWKALWNGELWKNNTVLGSIYNAALRTNLEKLGYETQITGKHGQFEIKGVARDVIEAFSQRRLTILATAEKLGKSANDTEALREITKRTRDPKLNPDDKLALRQEWAKRAAGLGFDAKALVEQARERGSEGRESPLGSPQRVQETLSGLRDSVKLYTRPADTLTTNGLQRITLTPTQLRTEMATASAIRIIGERETSWTRGDLVKTALDLGVKGVTADGVEARIGVLVADGRVLEGKSDRLDGRPEKYTTPEHVEIERATLANVAAGMLAYESDDLFSERIAIAPVAGPAALARDQAGRAIAPQPVKQSEDLATLQPEQRSRILNPKFAALDPHQRIKA